MKRYFDLRLLAMAILSAIIHAFAITNFSIPSSLYPAGFSGISRITTDLLEDFFSISLSYSFLYLFLNVLATLFVYRKIGKKFALYSIVQFSLVAVLTSLFHPVIMIEDAMLTCIFGGIINGCGVGLALAFDFSTGGFDFLSVYFANKYKKDVWNYIFSINLLILVTAGVIYGWQRALYSIIYQYTSTTIIKSLHQRYTHKTLTIITTMPEEVSANIVKTIRHGITEIHATGFYSHSDRTLLYTIVNSFQYKAVIKAAMDIDPHAFINVQNSLEIYGNYYQKPLD